VRCEKTGTCSAGGGGSGGPDDPPTYVLAFDPRIDDTLNKIVVHDAQLAYNTQSLNRVNHRVEGLRHQVEAVDRRVNKLQDEVQKNDKKALRGIASTAALSNAVQPSAPGKTVIGVGAATYEGVHAFAITVSHRPEKFSQMSFQGGIGTSGSGKPVMRVGISYQF
jgi:autotransporter adhesin